MAAKVQNRIKVSAFNSHVHFRQGTMMRAVVPFTAANFTGCIVEPNLEIPIVSMAQAILYRDQILAAVPEGMNLDVHMALYLCEYLTPRELFDKAPFRFVLKVYPKHGTIKSSYGVDFEQLFKNTGHGHWCLHLLASAEKAGLIVQFHGEVPVWRGEEVDLFDRERIFYHEIAPLIRQTFPNLKMACEHISTQEAVEWIYSQPEEFVTASVTPHHLLKNRTDWLGVGSDSSMECKPPLKRKDPHQQALIDFVTSGNPRAQAGTDSAPHLLNAKHAVRTACGAFVDHAALPMYATIFEKAGALNKLPSFLAENSRRFYDLDDTNRIITLVRESHTVPEIYELGGGQVQPFAHGEIFPWRVEVLNK